MRLAVIYNPNDRKLKPYSYSTIYKGMLDGLIEAFDGAQLITTDCHARDIDADVIVFFDPQSCHHLNIENIAKHPAVKLEYMSDPHQDELEGTYRQDGSHVHKLGAEQRMARVKERGIDYIISPVRQGFIRFLGDYIEDIRLLYFPPSPAFDITVKPFSERIPLVLGNGATWSGSLACYELRKWAFQQSYVHVIPHFLENSATPSGEKYAELLYQYAGGLALSEFYPVPKYWEMAAAGMVVFAQYHQDYEDMGFTDYDTCIYVTKENMEERIKAFLENPKDYELIGRNAQELMREYTAKKFGEFIYGKTKTAVH